MNAITQNVLQKMQSILLAAIVVLSLWVWGATALEAQTGITTKPYRVSLPIPNELTKKKGLSYGEEVEHLAGSLTKAYKIPSDRAQNFADWILQASTYSDVPEELLAGLIMTESSFKYNSVSSSGAIGPGQLKPKYWNKKCPGGLKNPKNNVMCAATVLRHYYEEYCDANWQCAVRTYNVGPSNMNERLTARASIRYLKKVNNHMQILANIHQFDSNFSL
jgi:Soluble lytic murein transglycosylase and related regulatory proteins (some contain LysM/invasin domains)